MPGLGDIISGLFGEEKMARQFFVWSVASAIIQELMGPYLTSIGNAMNDFSPEVVISPADLSSMVVRGIMSQADGAATARKSGISEFDFDLLVQNTGEPPSVIDMLMLFRRGKVDRAAVERAIRQSHVRDEWVSTLFMLGQQPPSPADILRAVLQGQTDDATGRALYEKLGGDPEYYQLMFDTEGSAPTPDEAATMANRGIIPWSGRGAGVVSFEQAFLEGPWRNKWLAPYQKAAQYYPPPRTITAMHASGALSDADAARLLKQQGLDDALVAAYLKDSSSTKNQKAKDLAESTIQTLYMAHAIDENQAIAFLGQLKYNKTDAQFIISAWTLARDLSAKNTAISTVHSNFVGHKIDAGKAGTTLDRLGVPSNQRDYLIGLWTQEKAAKVAVLTAAEIKKAMNDSFISPENAVSRLVNMGYSQDDAELYLAL